MSKTVTIYGASDDLIEVEGDISDEFGAYGADEEQPKYVHFDEGTVLSVYYDEDGIWKIGRVKEGTAEYEHTPGVDDDDHSDRATLKGINSIRCCDGVDGPDSQEMLNDLQHYDDWRGLSEDDLRKVYDILCPPLTK